ncbi:hypothetical protein NPS01_37430 [Nocardioides psychrotolerans]|uniref:helix-turn-helix domain-containing protein n=1 Tax=Nocardioides psychrotolerans TaxID=1005945 RepID=UPI00118ED7C0|nr:helix-turn-helix transcriptional regulator [Nocardioides psychrotolerans]GEP40080.1 hypothetical protein NPS01_37430 [Nocardioides psychrotolerans]
MIYDVVGLGTRASARGTVVCVSMSSSVEKLRRGGPGGAPGTGGVHLADDGVAGQDTGLSVREADVTGRIAQGLSNREIADQLYLSINSVKTYIRTGLPQARADPAQPGGRVGHARPAPRGPRRRGVKKPWIQMTKTERIV